MFTIQLLTIPPATTIYNGLIELLRDTVEGGASVGFLQENGRHRAEVQKLLVHSRYRNQGLGRRLMDAIESEARQRGISLVVLDTAVGEYAERFYLALGYTRAGEIPNYARFPDGRFCSTAIFYKQL